MIYPYSVKHNGVWYPAGADVPVGNFISEPVEEETEKVEEAETPVLEPKRRGRKPGKK